MLKFRSLGDGDCLYNTEAVWLISSFMQGKLDPLLKNKTRVNEFHKLLKAFEADELTEVAEKPSEKAVRDGFTQLIENFTENGQVQWVGLQQHLSIALRQYVQNIIITDETTKRAVKGELTRALNQCIDMAYVDGALVEDLEEGGINGSHFEGMETIVEKIAEVLQDDTYLAAEDKKNALRAWFFEGDAVGFNEYLQGENGIGNVSVHAGDIELKVLSSKLGIVHKTFMRGAIEDERAATYYNGFQAEDKARKVGKNALVFAFEKSPIHWNCLLEDNPANNRIIQVYNAQRAERTKLDILEKHGTFKKHHTKDLKDLSVKEYCQIHNITRKEYNNPAKVKKEEEEKAKQTAKADKRNKSTQSAEKSNGSSLNISANIEVSDYALYFILTAAVVAVMSQFLLVPMLTPALTSLLIGTKLATYVSTLAIGMTLGMSALTGYIVAEKMQTNNEPATPAKPGSVTKNTADKAKNDVIDLTEKSPTMLIYQNTRAQARRREQAGAADALTDRCTVRPTLH